MINSSIDHLNKIIGLYFRQNLTRYYHEKYLSGMTFYQITNLDNRIANPDQIFTNDIEKWSIALSNLFLNFSKPCLDLVLFSRKLSESIGIHGPILMIGWYLVTGLVMRYITPPFGTLTAIEQSNHFNFSFRRRV